MLRPGRPVVRAVILEGLPVWLVTRYSDVRAALADQRLAKDGAALDEVKARLISAPHVAAAPRSVIDAHLLNTDLPDHTRLRTLVARGFTRHSVAALEPRMTDTASDLADGLRTRFQDGVVDLLDAFAFPFVTSVICDILGIRPDGRDAFAGWVRTWNSSAASPADRACAARAMSDYMSRIVEEKRGSLGDDVMSLIVRAAEDGDRLSQEEAVAMAYLLFAAGFETTVSLIGNGMYALLRDRAQLDALRADPSLIPGAIEEFLRFDGPINLATMRFTTEPVTIAGTRIPSGEIVMLSLASANRDSAQFDRADQLDIWRKAGHLAFGHGIHHCIGAPLARLEGAVAFRILLGRFPGIALAESPDDTWWQRSTLVRGLSRLPVRLEPDCG
jgi:cytochrome P450